MTQDKEVIYVNGDSFAAGTDLADHLIPGCPEEQSLDDLMNRHDSKRIMDYVNWRHDYYNKMDTKPLMAIEEANRWSSKLSKIIDKPVINKAHPGSDNFSIFIRTCSDVNKLKAQGYRISKIIIQITGFMRYSYIRDKMYSANKVFNLDLNALHRLELEDGFFIRHVMPIQMESDKITEKENEFLKRSFYEECVYDDQLSTTKLIGNLLTLKMYKDAVKGATGIDPLIVDSWFMKSYLIYTDTEKYLENKNSYESKLFREIFSDQFITMFDIPDFNEKSLTAGGHFNLTVHEKFAKLLAERYFNE
jgi:hypothetical protein